MFQFLDGTLKRTDNNDPMCILSLIKTTIYFHLYCIKKFWHLLRIIIVSIYLTQNMFKSKIFLCLINNSFVAVELIDLSGDEGRFLQPIQITAHSIGFLPNGDLILVSLESYPSNIKNIYKYSFINKPTDATLCQIYDIETHKSSNNCKIPF